MAAPAGHSTVTVHLPPTLQKGSSLCFGLGLCILRPSSNCSTHQASSRASCSACDGLVTVAESVPGPCRLHPHREGPRNPHPIPLPLTPQIRDHNRSADSHLERTRGPHPPRLRTALAWASALRGASSGAGFSEAFPSPFDTEAPFRVFFFFFGFLEATSPSPPTGCALEAASLHAGCP